MDTQQSQAEKAPIVFWAARLEGTFRKQAGLNHNPNVLSVAAKLDGEELAILITVKAGAPLAEVSIIGKQARTYLGGMDAIYGPIIIQEE